MSDPWSTPSQPQALYSSELQRVQRLQLEQRLLQARQQNVLCKQRVVQNLLLPQHTQPQTQPQTQAQLLPPQRELFAPQQVPQLIQQALVQQSPQFLPVQQPVQQPIQQPMFQQPQPQSQQDQVIQQLSQQLIQQQQSVQQPVQQPLQQPIQQAIQQSLGQQPQRNRSQSHSQSQSDSLTHSHSKTLSPPAPRSAINARQRHDQAQPETHTADVMSERQGELLPRPTQRETERDGTLTGRRSRERQTERQTERQSKALPLSFPQDRALSALSAEVQTALQELSLSLEKDLRTANPQAREKERDKERDKEREREREERQRHRQQIESLLERQREREKENNTNNNNNDDNKNRKKSTLRGKRRWQIIAHALLVLVLRPQHTLRTRQLAVRAAARRECLRVLHVLCDALDDWIARAVTLSVRSLATDESVDVNPKEDSLLLGKTKIAFRSRMVQLKVRVKSIVTAICTCLASPPPHLKDLLVSFIEDGNYFPDGFLWDCEKNELSFTSLGATRDMVPPWDENAQQNGTSAFKVEVLCENESDNDGEKVRKAFDGSRVRNLLINVVLVRSLVSRVILSPWQFKIARKPAHRHIYRTILNLRATATVIYLLTRKVNSTLPSVSEQQQQWQQAQKGQERAAQDSLALSSSLSSSPPQSQSRGLFGGLFRSLGLADTALRMDPAPVVSSAEAMLLQTRPQSCGESLADVCVLLLGEQAMSEAALALVEDWSREFAPLLSSSVDTLTTLVVESWFRKHNETRTSPRDFSPRAA